MKSDYEIQKNLVLSTVHITQTDNDLLYAFLVYQEHVLAFDEKELPDLIVDELPCGFRINISDELKYSEKFITAMIEFGFSYQLTALINLAKQLGCQWLVIDANGQICDNLVKFNW